MQMIITPVGLFHLFTRDEHRDVLEIFMDKAALVNKDQVVL